MNKDLQKAINLSRKAAEVTARLEQLFFETKDYRGLRDRIFQVLEDREAALKSGQMKAHGVAILGMAGAGKSRLVEQVISDYGSAVEQTGGREFGHEIISVVVPGRATVIATLKAILDELGYPVSGSPGEQDLQTRLQFLLKENRIAGIHLDEVQDVGRYKTDDSYERFAKKFRNLMQDPGWPVCLILSATPDAKAFLNHDRTLTRRLAPLEMHPISKGDPSRLRVAIKTLLDTAGLHDRGLLALDEFFQILTHASADCFGIAIEITIKAMSLSVLSGDHYLYADHFAKAYEWRTDCARDLNPFLVQDWHLIETCQVLTRESAERKKYHK